MTKDKIAAFIRAHYNVDMTAKDIAAALTKKGALYSKNAVIGLARRLGLSKPERAGQRIVSKAPLGSHKVARPVVPKVAPVVPLAAALQAVQLARRARRPRVLRPEDQPPEPVGPWGTFSPPDTCYHIHGDPMRTPWRCCGYPRAPGQPYCAPHALTKYVPSRPHRRTNGERNMMFNF